MLYFFVILGGIIGYLLNPAAPVLSAVLGAVVGLVVFLVLLLLAFLGIVRFFMR